MCALFLAFYGASVVGEPSSLKNLFVSRWAWWSICDFRYSNDRDDSATAFPIARPFKPEDVFPGSVIFIPLSGMRKFFKEMHPAIKNPYIPLTLYYDGDIHHEIINKYIDDSKIIAWFGMSPVKIESKKFHFIPLGVYRDKAMLYDHERINNLFKKLYKKNKSDSVYVNFTIHEGRGQETAFRRNIYNLFQAKPFAVYGKQRPFEKYLKDMARCKFALSPQGDMDDCFRHWESILVGSIPVISRYNHLGARFSLEDFMSDLPVIFVDDYSEMTLELLQKKALEFGQKTFNYDKLYMNYWVNKITQIKNEYMSIAW